MLYYVRVDMALHANPPPPSLSLSLFLSLSLLPFSCSSIASCCRPGNSCVILGGAQAYLSVFPREAMAPYKPYPFGLDPVSREAEINNFDINVSITVLALPVNSFFH